MAGAVQRYQTVPVMEPARGSPNSVVASIFEPASPAGSAPAMPGKAAQWSLAGGAASAGAAEAMAMKSAASRFIGVWE